jgi:hypothetical protein
MACWKKTTAGPAPARFRKTRTRVPKVLEERKVSVRIIIQRSGRRVNGKKVGRASCWVLDQPGAARTGSSGVARTLRLGGPRLVIRHEKPQTAKTAVCATLPPAFRHRSLGQGLFLPWLFSMMLTAARLFALRSIRAFSFILTARTLASPLGSEKASAQSGKTDL